jgi:GTP pyrophosphokinase
MAKKEFDIAGYRELMVRYLGDPGQSARVFFEALDFAEKAHAGQKRKSGEPYILHPCQVARILTEEMEVRNPEILAAALLHDTVEDVEDVTIERIGELFGRFLRQQAEPLQAGAPEDIFGGCGPSRGHAGQAGRQAA